MNETTRDEMFDHMNSLSNRMVCADVGSLLDYAESDEMRPVGMSVLWDTA